MVVSGRWAIFDVKHTFGYDKSKPFSVTHSRLRPFELIALGTLRLLL